MLDLKKISKSHVDDVEEFLQENQDRAEYRGKTVADLTERQFFEYWLLWNGIVGYNSDIVELLESLGWKRADP